MASWELVAGDYAAEGEINGAAAYNGRIYAVTFPSAVLLRTNAAFDDWEKVADSITTNTTVTHSVVVKNSRLYAFPGYDVGAPDPGFGNVNCFRLNAAGDAWEHRISGFGSSTLILSGLLYNGEIRVIGNSDGGLQEVNATDDAWTAIAAEPEASANWLAILGEFGGRLYSSMAGGLVWSANELYKINDADNAWVSVADGSVLPGTYVLSIIEWEGELYGISLSFDLYRLNAAGNAWELALAAPAGGMLSFIYQSGLVIIGDKLFAMDTVSSVLWEVNSGATSWTEHEAVPTEAGGTISVYGMAENDGYLYAYGRFLIAGVRHPRLWRVPVDTTPPTPVPQPGDVVMTVSPTEGSPPLTVNLDARLVT